MNDLHNFLSAAADLALQLHLGAAGDDERARQAMRDMEAAQDYLSGEQLKAAKKIMAVLR
jgi:hypothetical protein